MGRRILIGPCGGLTGCYLARQFKKIDGCTEIGADIDIHNAAHPFLDEIAILPLVSDPTFRTKLAEALDRYKIDCYLPTHSQEIKTAAKNEAWLQEVWSGDFLVSPYETYLQLDNKRDAHESLRQAGIPVPQSIDAPGPGGSYPVFMKPDVGSGGKRTQTVESRTLHREYARLYPNCSFYERIQGRDYTVNRMFDVDGRLIAYDQRARIKSMGGAVTVTQNDYVLDILPYLKKIGSAFLIKRCVNFQYILSGDIPYFTDVPLRYASGGLPLTVASGIDVPQILLDIWAGRPVDCVQSCGADRRTMYRYFEEWYEDP